MFEPVYIGLGSNLEQPAEQIKKAVLALKQLPESQYIDDSGLYLSKPMLLDKFDTSDAQPDYYNAVVLIKTKLEPLSLLDRLQEIENNQGRVRERRWQARSIDLDILLMGEKQWNEPRLTLPHPGIAEREFVLFPLRRLCVKLQQSDLHIPGHGMLSEVIKTCSENELKYVGEVV